MTDRRTQGRQIFLKTLRGVDRRVRGACVRAQRRSSTPPRVTCWLDHGVLNLKILWSQITIEGWDLSRHGRRQRGRDESAVEEVNRAERVRLPWHLSEPHIEKKRKYIPLATESKTTRYSVAFPHCRLAIEGASLAVVNEEDPERPADRKRIPDLQCESIGVLT